MQNLSTSILIVLQVVSFRTTLKISCDLVIFFVLSNLVVGSLISNTTFVLFFNDVPLVQAGLFLKGLGHDILGNLV